MANKRVLWADNLKGFLILLVVAGHVLQSAIDTHINGIHSICHCFFSYRGLYTL